MNQVLSKYVESGSIALTAFLLRRPQVTAA